VAPSAEYLQSPLQFLKGVGPRRAAEFRRAGLETVEDLLHRFPFRYEDRAAFTAIAALQPGQVASVAGEVVTTTVHPTRRRGFKIFEMLVRDASGVAKAVYFNQPFMLDVFHPGQQVILFGKAELLGTHGTQIKNPQYEIVQQEPGPDAAPEDMTPHMGRIVPVYEKLGTMSAKQQRSIVFGALEKLPRELPDPLPADIRARRRLPDVVPALHAIHFPEPGEPVAVANAFRTPAQVRVIFEEFFLFQLGLQLRRRALGEERKPHRIAINDGIRESVRKILPFKLTPGQREAIKEIVDDLVRPAPMNRLLQGDVGSGKTIVALMAAIVAMENGAQVAFMAPTEILADQHYITIRTLLERSRFRVASLTGSTPARRKREIGAELQSGAINMVIGTHALVEGPVGFGKLGLVIIDEQHRFGVMQRAKLREKGLLPDVLVMTATPIPRTLALTAYGDLDVSVIRDMPPGRKPIQTTARPESRRQDVYDFLRKQVEQGRQAYVIYPLIEESEKIDVKAATAMADHLANDVFPEFRVALLHGRLKQDAKDHVMQGFLRREYDILVSTTVVEVGVDVPNATVMVVEHAERFGLSQLHQLRGRVGRSEHQSWCILLYQHPLSEDAGQRLRAITSTTDGFVLAEKDLELRGPGDFFGTRQSGAPLLRVGDLVRDFSIMEEARQDAIDCLAQEAGVQPLIEHVRATWARRFGLVGVG
jgi:ATP-dependent DNA helicase RecG